MSKDIEILNGALEAEQFAIAAYTVAGETGLLSEAAMHIAKTFQAHHAHHAHRLIETIRGLGGEPVKALAHNEYVEKMPLGMNSEKEIAHYALTLEKGAAIAYLNAIPEIENPQIAQAAGSILGDEAMHWAALRSALGMEPVHISFIPTKAEEAED